jgi:hypothetical protein
MKSYSDSVPPVSVAMFMESQLWHIIIFCLYFYKGNVTFLDRSVTFVSNPLQFVNRAWPSKWLLQCHGQNAIHNVKGVFLVIITWGFQTVQYCCAVCFSTYAMFTQE